MYKLYSIKDTLAETYEAPMMFKNDMVACRTFSDACKNEQTPLNKHPENYEFWCVGLFDENTGVITADEIKEIAKATNYTTNTALN